MSRVRWHPSAKRRCHGSSRRCQTATSGSGERPCSRKCNAPPGRTTRRNSDRARRASGTVHNVNVERAASQLASSRGMDWPSSPTCSTGIGEEEIRRAASRRATSAGSTARTTSTVGWIVRDIESGTEADLDHPTVQPVGDVGTPRCHCLRSRMPGPRAGVGRVHDKTPRQNRSRARLSRYPWSATTNNTRDLRPCPAARTWR